MAPAPKGSAGPREGGHGRRHPISDIEIVGEPRHSTGMGEFDRSWAAVSCRFGHVDRRRPGIGKTTLLLQALPLLAESGEQVLYVSGEESPADQDAG